MHDIADIDQGSQRPTDRASRANTRFGVWRYPIAPDHPDGAFKLPTCALGCRPAAWE